MVGNQVLVPSQRLIMSSSLSFNVPTQRKVRSHYADLPDDARQAGFPVLIPIRVSISKYSAGGNLSCELSRTSILAHSLASGFVWDHLPVILRTSFLASIPSGPLLSGSESQVSGTQ